MPVSPWWRARAASGPRTCCSTSRASWRRSSRWCPQRWRPARSSTATRWCAARDSCVPSAFEGGITNGAWSLGIVGVAIYLVVAVLAVKGGRWAGPTRSAARRPSASSPPPPSSRSSSCSTSASTRTTCNAGHYFAAVPMFGALTAVVVINALRSERATVTMGARTVDWRYAALALWMGVVLVAAGVPFRGGHVGHRLRAVGHLGLWVELLLWSPSRSWSCNGRVAARGSPGLTPGAHPTRRSRRCSSWRAGSVVTPPWTGPGWSTVLRGALRKPKRGPSGCAGRRTPARVPARHPLDELQGVAHLRRRRGAGRGPRAGRRRSATPTSRKSAAWQ